MSRVKNFFRNRWVISILVIVVISTSIAVAVTLINRSDYMTVRAIAGNDIVQHRARDYRHSQLWLNDNGTFAVQIIFTQGGQSKPVFIGIGKYQRNGNTFTFTYIDMFREFDGVFGRDNTHSNWVVDYTRTNGRIRLHCPNDRVYFFR